MEDENLTFTVIDENGKEIECDVLATFTNAETGKDYIIYTDYDRDENGCTKVYASILVSDGENTVIQAIETDKEWEVVEAALEKVQAELMDDEED